MTKLLIKCSRPSKFRFLNRTKESDHIRQNIKFNSWACTGISPKVTLKPQSTVQTLLEHCQDWCCDHLPGEAVPVPKHPLGEQLFSNMQPVPPQHNLRWFSRSCQWSSQRRDQCLPLLFPSWGSCDCTEVFPQCPPAEQTKWPQSLLSQLLLKALCHLHYPTLVLL